LSASIAIQPQDVPTIQLNVNKILVPVVVRDRHGEVVDNLKLEDFQVFDNDKPHPVSSIAIERHAFPRANAATPIEIAPKTGQTAIAARPAASPQRFIVLLFDDLHLSNENMAQAKSAAERVLSETLVGRDIGAVISLSQKSNSGLTRDRKRMLDTIASLQPHAVYKADETQCPNIDYYQADLIENKHDATAFQDAVRKVFNCEPGLDPRYNENVAENEASSTARRILALGRQDALTTYASIAAFVRSMANLPGERVMILVSPGFLRIEQDSLTAESRLMNLAAEANVTISALDARGLYTTSITASEKSPSLGGSSLQQNSEYHANALTQSEDPLAELADGTGGTFFHNSNDLGAGLKALAETPEVVYVLELSADNSKPDGSYHRLKVKVAGDGMQIQARRGYYIPKSGKTKK
jgi:VWFA-related protein